MTNRATPRILIVRVGAMGDVLHALPAVAALRAALLDAHIGWAVEPRWAPLLQGESATGRDARRMPLVDTVHRVEAKQWNRAPFSRATLKSVRALRAELRASRYDLAIDLQGTLRAAAIARFGSGAPVVGSSAPREGLARLFYTHRVAQSATHVIDRGLQLVAAALQLLRLPDQAIYDAQVSALHFSGLLPHDAAAEAWWAGQRTALCGGRAPVMLAATAGWGSKQWPPERFAELAARLVAEGNCVLLNTPPLQSFDPVTERVLHSIQRDHPAASFAVHRLPATLPQLIAATREARGVIAGDTGPLHLAEALGRPSVGLFGPTDPARTGARRNSLSIRGPGSVTSHRRHATTEAGLARIPVEAVLDIFHGVIDTFEETEANAEADTGSAPARGSMR